MKKNDLWEIKKDISWIKKKLFGNGSRGLIMDISLIKTKLENFEKNYLSYKQVLSYLFASIALLVVLIGGINYITINLSLNKISQQEIKK